MFKIFSGFKNLDNDTYKIMKYGLLFSFILTIISTSILLTYIILGNNFLFNLGITLIKLSFTFAVDFVICGIVVDSLRKQII